MKETELTKEKEKKTRGRAAKVCKIVGLTFALALFLLLTVHSLLTVFVKDYYPTFGKYRLFSVVSDSMKPTVPTGSMIVCRVPKKESDIGEGTVITFAVRNGKSTQLYTHRVIAVHRNEQTGEVSYTTKGDNAPGLDAVRPKYKDVVGVYTGKKCPVLGYVFGFLQSAEGAIALILCLAVAIVAVLTVHFVNGIRVWRTMATEALKRSGELLSSTQNDDLGTIADVIGIAVKDPHDKKDIARKDKKLHWFLRTGTLPKRPYSDDLQEDESAPANKQTILLPEVAERYVKEPYEQVRYEYTYAAKLAGLPPKQKEWYSRIKNALLRYKGVRARIGKRKERFSAGRKTAATLGVRGKTLRLRLAACDESGALSAENGKTVFDEHRITSERKVRYAERDIARAMRALNVPALEEYTPTDFYVPYEGLVSLMQRGLVKRKTRTGEKIFRIEEVTLPASQQDTPETVK